MYAVDGAEEALSTPERLYLFTDLLLRLSSETVI